MTEKIAVFAPMPRASVSTATREKPVFFASILIAKRTSWIRDPMIRHHLRVIFFEAALLRSFARASSFVAEGDQRVNLRGTPGRQEARAHSDDCEHEHHSDERP